ncbi:hypothetical protein M8C21_005159 [Ambrosia artemisiifolia]|uniref:Uncharacterized protein n=1 Tax=Ambrosia artemisiifolia TaxID=4212 RepID=A0AAD5C5D4_AMBAR|nr:hypothetical protein M8C21_005159 [Ambrosia artemisiifolia]
MLQDLVFNHTTRTYLEALKC